MYLHSKHGCVPALTYILAFILIGGNFYHGFSKTIEAFISKKNNTPVYGGALRFVEIQYMQIGSQDLRMTDNNFIQHKNYAVYGISNEPQVFNIEIKGDILLSDGELLEIIVNNEYEIFAITFTEKHLTIIRIDKRQGVLLYTTSAGVGIIGMKTTVYMGKLKWE
jgi:hypothetical protein